MNSRRLIAAVALAATVLVACGDTDDASDGASTDPSTATVAPVTTGEPDESTAPTSDVPPTTDAAPSTSLELSPTQPTVDDGSSPASTTPGGPVGESPSANLSAAVDDLAARLAVDPATVLVVSEQNVTWRNSAIGCPEPGMAYMDALVDGVRIVLDVDGTQYSYHAGGSRAIFYCENPQLPAD